MNDDTSTDPINTAFADFKKSLLQGGKGGKSSKYYRRIFLDMCYADADKLRTRSQPNLKPDENIGDWVLGTCGNLTSTRDHIVNWVLLESEIDPSEDFNEALFDMLNKLVVLKSRPPELSQWSDTLFEAHHVFVYETFLYIVAALMKTGVFNILHDVFNNRYIRPETEVHGTERFTKFGIFWGYSGTLQILTPEGGAPRSRAAEFIRQQANRTDLSFEDIIEAELLILMVSSINEDVRWHPQTFYYRPPETFPFFFNATQRRDFKKIAIITGIKDADELRKLVKAELKRIGTGMHEMYSFSNEAWERMNMDNLDTLY